MIWKDWAVTLWAKDIPGKSWLYIEKAQSGQDAIIQARLRHHGLGRPEVDPTRSIAKEK